jgi:hypothetical protein
MRASLALVFALTLATPNTAAVAQDHGVRQATVSERSVVPLTTKLRFTTMIILPAYEQLQEVICGDSDYWIISAAGNIAHIKPAKEGATTNLNLVTTSGSVYSFLLTEVQSSTPDLKVYITREGATVVTPRPPSTDTDVAQLEAQLSIARKTAGAAELRADEAISPAFASSTPHACSSPTAVPSTRSRFSCAPSGMTASSHI